MTLLAVEFWPAVEEAAAVGLTVAMVMAQAVA
jgi:hypothetical protein